MSNRFTQQIIMPMLRNFRDLRSQGAFDVAILELLSQPEKLESALPLRDGVKLGEVRKLLSRERVAQRMSLRDLAEQAGMDSANLGRLERGVDSNPTIGTLDRIAAALGKKLMVSFVYIEGQNKTAAKNSEHLGTPPCNPLDELLHQPSLDELFQQPADDFWKEFPL
jgi:transcriptional regulator with XRE-family HTH domain